MYKVINFFILTLIIIFIFGVLNFYLSSKNIDQRNFNRTNIDKILERKIIDLPLLENDTNNIIQYNDSFNNNFQIEKKRSSWNLLKSK